MKEKLQREMIKLAPLGFWLTSNLFLIGEVLSIATGRTGDGGGDDSLRVCVGEEK